MLLLIGPCVSPGMVVDIAQFKVCSEVVEMVHSESIQPVIILVICGKDHVEIAPYDPRAHTGSTFILQL